MFNRGSRPTFKETVVESVNSGIESANSTANSAANPLKIGLWVRVLSDEPEVFLPKYSKMAILHAAHFRRVVNLTTNLHIRFHPGHTPRYRRPSHNTRCQLRSRSTQYRGWFLRGKQTNCHHVVFILPLKCP